MDDLISRQAAIDATWKEPSYSDPINILTEVRDRIESLPSTQPERKTGRWIFPYGDKKYKKCSTCGRTYYSIPHTSNYCPNCGAKMEVEHETD